MNNTAASLKQKKEQQKKEQQTAQQKKAQSSIYKVLAYYNMPEHQTTISSLGNGLINDTYLISSAEKKIVLQRINDHVFQQPELITQNADLINQHLSNKQDQNKYPLAIIKQLTTTDEQTLLYIDESYWRAIEFIANTYSIELVETPEQAEKAASAFAQFNAALSDFPAKNLAEIIPDFHHLPHRLAQLKQAILADKVGRKNDCTPLIEQFLSQTDFIEQVNNMVKKLPWKVTHNDTKINNLLFSQKNDQVVAVIDLDTCMPGFLMHDFGDMVRTCCANLPEDGTDIENMRVNLPVFKALVTGYVGTLKQHICEVEKNSLVIGAMLLPFMVGMRFLTDYIDGDHYFHTQHQHHNLDRAKNQFQLFTLLQQQQQTLSDIIDDIYQK